MQFDDRQLTARLGVSLVDQLVHGDLRWIFRELQVSDVGIDGHIEQRVAGRATGRLIGVQIKSGPSWFRERTPDGWVYRGHPDHLDYWLEYALPVLLVLVDVERKVAYWRHVDVEHIERTPSGWKTTVSAQRRLDATARQPLDAIFGKTRRLLAVDKAALRPWARATAFEVARGSAMREKFSDFARDICTRLDAAGLGRVEIITGLPVPPSNGRVSTLLAGTHPQTGLPSYLVLDSDDETWEVFPGRAAHLGPGWIVPRSTAAQRAEWGCEALRYAMPLLHVQPDCVVPIVLPHHTQDHGGSDSDTVGVRDRFFQSIEEKLSDPAAYAVAELLLAGHPRPESRLASTPWQHLSGNRTPLTGAQEETLALLVGLIEDALRADHKEAVLIVGPSGSGKTTLSLLLLRSLLAAGLEAVHSTGSKVLTETLRRMDTGESPRTTFAFNSGFSLAAPNSVDVLICDAAHTLRESSVNRYARAELRAKSGPQVHELMRAARVAVFMLDEGEVIHPEAIGSKALIEKAAHDMNVRMHRIELTEIYRWGGSSYLHWVERLLGDDPDSRPLRLSDDTFTVQVADSPSHMESDLRAWREQGHTARIVAGYCWPWSSPAPDGSLVLDVRIGDWERPWVAKSEQLLNDAPAFHRWPTAPAGFGQIGMAHTVQGIDFGWCGVIMGPDLVRRGGRWQFNIEGSSDPAFRRIKSGTDAARLIRNTYRVLLTRARMGVIIYSVDPETRSYLHQCMQ